MKSSVVAVLFSTEIVCKKAAGSKVMETLRFQGKKTGDHPPYELG